MLVSIAGLELFHQLLPPILCPSLIGNGLLLIPNAQCIITDGPTRQTESSELWGRDGERAEGERQILQWLHSFCFEILLWNISEASSAYHVICAVGSPDGPMSVTPPLPSQEPGHVDLGGLVYIAIIYAIFFAVFLFLFCYCAMAQDSGCHCHRRNPRMFQDRPEIEGVNALPFSKKSSEEDAEVRALDEKAELTSVLSCDVDQATGMQKKQWSACDCQGTVCLLPPQCGNLTLIMLQPQLTAFTTSSLLAFNQFSSFLVIQINQRNSVSIEMKNLHTWWISSKGLHYIWLFAWILLRPITWEIFRRTQQSLLFLMWLGLSPNQYSIKECILNSSKCWLICSLPQNV